MSTKMFITTVLVFMTIIVLAGGCAKKCYKVTDASTNKVYYTHKVDRECDGRLKFRDARTSGAWTFGEKVCLESAQIERVQRCECRSEDITDPPCPKLCHEKLDK